MIETLIFVTVPLVIPVDIPDFEIGFPCARFASTPFFKVPPPEAIVVPTELPLVTWQNTASIFPPNCLLEVAVATVLLTTPTASPVSKQCAAETKPYTVFPFKVVLQR